MRWIQTANEDSELQDLMRATASNLVYTIAELYLTWHIIATLGYPQYFSPSLWSISIYMLALTLSTRRLMKKRYLTAQLFWLAGLTGAVILAYAIYQRGEILFFLTLLPLLAVVTLGIPVAAAITVFVNLIGWALIRQGGLPQLYFFFLPLASLFTTVFGWGVSSNLLQALNTASYHYHEARRLLEETRDHRAEISRMLKDRNQVNYQLERMNDMLVAARVQAEDARENRNRFMLAVSHELRSPLNFIIGFSDLMINAPETYAPLETWPPGLYDDAQEIYTSSKHLMRLINDILDMGKIDARQMTLYREKTQIEQVAADVRKMLASAFAQKGIELRLNLAPSLPAVSMDTTRIRQVLINLLNNSLRFTDQGSVTLQVEKQADSLLVSVIDTGTGIAAEDLPKVFDEFRQVGEENWRRRSGTGLGLYISRHFVELHGGKMHVASTPGLGTRFWFTLPLENTTLPETSVTGEERPDPRRDNRLLLLLSPRAEDASLLQHSTERYNLQRVETIADAEQALKNQFPRAVILTGGVDDLPITSLPYDLPILRLDLPRPSRFSANLRTHLVKPVRREVFLRAIEALGADLATLLVVDDDPAMTRFVSQTLRARKSGPTLRILSAHDGDQASILLAANRVDAILLDMELPDGNGWDWLQNSPALENIPVIVISAQDVAETSLASGKSELTLTLRRPLTIVEMQQILNLVLATFPPQYP